MRSIHIKRSELYASKGQVKLSPATKESHTPTNDELNETLAEIITKKYIGENLSNPSLSAEAVAIASNISPGYLRTIFKMMINWKLVKKLGK